MMTFSALYCLVLLQAMHQFERDESGYQKIQGTKPQTLAYALTVRDSKPDRREKRQARAASLWDLCSRQCEHCVLFCCARQQYVPNSAVC